MKLPMLSRLFIGEELINEKEVEFEIGDIRTDRVRCYSCWKDYTSRKEYVEIDSSGLGGWLRISKHECRI